MAGDKLKDGFPIAVQFAAGEQPSDAKLNGWANQTQNALKALERAVGDIFDQSKALGGTNRLSNRDLQITSIGRLIGPASMLSPQILHDVRISDFLWSVPVGTKEFVLPHPPLVSGGPSVIDWNGSARFTDEKVSQTALEDAGDFFVDYTTGRVFTYSVTQAGDTAEYDFDSIGDSFDNASLNVIPDPNQSSERCEISAATGGFYSDLPFIKYDQDGALATDGSDPNYSDVASAHNTQRAQLPEFLAVLSVGDVIPAGFIYLFDHNINAIVEGAVYRYESQTRFKVENVNLEIGSSRYSTLTVGAPLAEVLYTVRKLQREHIHDGSDGGQRVAHANLTGNIYDQTDTWGAADMPLVELGYTTSQVTNNEHPHYLMRSGYKVGIDPHNSDNAMRGEILMGSVTPSGNDFANITADSRSIFFGSEAGPRFRYNNTYDALQLAAKDLMADNNVTVGRSSALNSNLAWFGFGSDPDNNHITLDEAHAVSPRFRFLIDGTTTAADVEAGDFIAVGSSPPRYYFGDKTGASDSYIERDGGDWQVVTAGNPQSGEFKMPVARIANRIYFDYDGDEEYISYNDSSNIYTFVADSSIASAKIECGNLRLNSGNSIIEMPNSSNRLYKSGYQFVFDHNGNWKNSAILAKEYTCSNGSSYAWITYNKWVDLTDGGRTTQHYHRYYRYAATYGSLYIAKGNGDHNVYTNSYLRCPILRGWAYNGGHNNQAACVYRASNRFSIYTYDHDDNGTVFYGYIWSTWENTG